MSPAHSLLFPDHLSIVLLQSGFGVFLFDMFRPPQFGVEPAGRVSGSQSAACAYLWSPSDTVMVNGRMTGLNEWLVRVVPNAVKNIGLT